MRRGAQRQADQGGRCLSEASLARPRLTRAPQGARSAAEGRRHQGRLFLAHLILAKQKKVSRPPRRQSGIGIPQCACSINQEANSEPGILWVRARIRHALVARRGCCAAKSLSDPITRLRDPFLKLFWPLAEVIRAQAAMKIVAIRNDELTGIRSRTRPPNPCECADERRFRRIRDRDCLSRRRVRAGPRLDRAPQVARSAAEGRRQ
jgi:hypothetical protein